ncbi:N-acylphosphatidylethanolamine synthase [Glycine max]|nr:N-acylphosphatidylethanolamine synthase [Glycine max]
MSRTMEWAARAEHLRGISRKVVIAAVGAFAKTVSSLLNTAAVHNADTLLRLVRSRPHCVPLINVSNHMSTLDDPVMWGFKGFPIFDTKLARWVFAAEDICFKNALYSYIFRLHTFPEGKVYQEDVPIRRLKWGTASLIVRAPITPIVLPIVHHGFHEVMPEKYMFGRRPPVPLWNKKIDIIIGDPIEFDLPAMRQKAISQSRNESFPTIGWPSTPDGLDELAQRCLYTAISEQIRAAMERLRCFGKSFVKSWVGSNLPKSEIKQRAENKGQHHS